MRTFALAALIFLSSAPAAFAYGYQANGSTCGLPDGSECQSGVCSDVLGSRTCAPCTATSCGSNAVCQSDGTCLANPAAQTQVQTGPAITDTQVQTGPAITNAPGPNVTLLNPLKGVDCSKGNGNCLSAFLLNILDFIINIGSIVVILMLVFVGYKFVAAQGSDSKITEARQMLLWTVIGALVLLGAKAISAGILATVQALGG